MVAGAPAIVWVTMQNPHGEAGETVFVLSLDVLAFASYIQLSNQSHFEGLFSYLETKKKWCSHLRVVMRRMGWAFVKSLWKLPWALPCSLVLPLGTRCPFRGSAHSLPKWTMFCTHGGFPYQIHEDLWPSKHHHCLYLWIIKWSVLSASNEHLRTTHP